MTAKPSCAACLRLAAGAGRPARTGAGPATPALVGSDRPARRAGLAVRHDPRTCRPGRLALARRSMRRWRAADRLVVEIADLATHGAMPRLFAQLASTPGLPPLGRGLSGLPARSPRALMRPGLSDSRLRRCRDLGRGADAGAARGDRGQPTMALKAQCCGRERQARRASSKARRPASSFDALPEKEQRDLLAAVAARTDAARRRERRPCRGLAQGRHGGDRGRDAQRACWPIPNCARRCSPPATAPGQTRIAAAMWRAAAAASWRSARRIWPGQTGLPAHAGRAGLHGHASAIAGNSLPFALHPANGARFPSWSSLEAWREVRINPFSKGSDDERNAYPAGRDARTGRQGSLPCTASRRPCPRRRLWRQ